MNALQSIVAVVGTLLGVGMGGLLQMRVARESRRQAWRQQAVDAISRLTGAIEAHRVAMWHRENDRIQGAAGQHDVASTRSAISAPLTSVRIYLPQLYHLAEAAAQATYALRHAENINQLADLREAAIHALERMLERANTLLGPSR